MNQKALSKWLKLILAGVFVCGLIVYALVVPAYGKCLVSVYPEFSNRFWPWLIFIWGSAIPCFMVLFKGWRISASIGNDRSFTDENAVLLKSVSVLAAVDAGYFFSGNLVLLFLNMSHPGVVIGSLVIVFIGVAVSVAAAALSHLVKKAAVLQEQSDWTI